MALTFRRWVVAAALGAAAVWLALFHGGSAHATTEASASNPRASAAANNSFPEREAADLAGKAMSQAADRLRLLQIRDSILRDPRVRRADAFTVLIGSAFGAGIDHQLDSSVHARWSEAGSPAAVRTVIAAVLDSSTVVAGGLRPKLNNPTSIAVFVPDSGSGGTCLAILRISEAIDGTSARVRRRNLIAPETIGALLGPCLYYASFGTPGPEVARWLRDGAWRIAAVTNWNAPPPPLATHGLSILNLVPFGGLTGPTFEYEPRVWTSTLGLECMAGQPNECTAALMPRPRATTDSLWGRAVVSAYGANDFAFNVARRRATLGPSEVWLLSEMVRSVGKDRFGKFWRSSEPVPSAFRSATGQSLDAWVHDWAVRMYGPLATGPGLEGSDVIVGIVFLIAGFTAAAAVARARRVS